MCAWCVLNTEDVDSTEGGESGGGSGNSYSQWVILALSLLVTTVVGYVNFMNPAQRWQQLRGTQNIDLIHLLCALAAQNVFLLQILTHT